MIHLQRERFIVNVVQTLTCNVVVCRTRSPPPPSCSSHSSRTKCTVCCCWILQPMGGVITAKHRRRGRADNYSGHGEPLWRSLRQISTVFGSRASIFQRAISYGRKVILVNCVNDQILHYTILFMGSVMGKIVARVCVL